MNLEQYLSFWCLSHSQMGDRSCQNRLNMSEEEKLFHYLTLKRWTQDYQSKHRNLLQEPNCPCKTSEFTSTLTKPNKIKKSVSAIDKIQTHSKLTKQSKAHNDRNDDFNILAIFFKKFYSQLRAQKSDFKKIFHKLKLQIQVNGFERWICSHIPEEKIQICIQEIKSLLQTQSSKEQSLILRVLLKRFLREEAKIYLLSSQNAKNFPLKQILFQIRSINKQLFDRKK